MSQQDDSGASSVSRSGGPASLSGHGKDSGESKKNQKNSGPEVVTKSGVVLTRGPNDKREPGRVHDELHAPCGCAFHEQPGPHWHPCPRHQ